jgi:hypothetical protein
VTTRILTTTRYLRIVVAAILVYGSTLFLSSLTAMIVATILLVGLAWFIVPMDRRWFVPLTVLAGFWFWVWPRPTVMYDINGGRQKIIVHRLTGHVELTGIQRDPVPLKPYRPPPFR